MSELKVDGVFIAIGRKPNSDLFKDLEKDKRGFLKITGGSQTSIPFVFIAGDVQDARYRQVIVAAGAGAKAAIDAERFLKD